MELSELVKSLEDEFVKKRVSSVTKSFTFSMTFIFVSLSSITDLSDGSYIYFDSYQNCSNEVGVDLILHSTMGHTWPSTNNHSMSATAEVWSFFKDYDLNGKID